MKPITPLGTFQQTPFWKLRARFRDCGLFDAELAQAAGIAQATLSRRMRGHTPWGADEIERICQVVGIQQSEVGEYFFPNLENEEEP